MAPVGRSAFEFPALTYFSERAEERVAYVTLFPVGNRVRANLFVYREVDDPWLRRPGQAGLRRLVDGQSRQLPQGHD